MLLTVQESEIELPHDEASMEDFSKEADLGGMIPCCSLNPVAIQGRSGSGRVLPDHMRAAAGLIHWGSLAQALHIWSLSPGGKSTYENM